MAYWSEGGAILYTAIFRSFIIGILFFAPLVLKSEPNSHKSSNERPIKIGGGYNWGDSLSMVLVDPSQKKAITLEEKHPWIRLFENGKDVMQRDLQSTLDFLKFVRSIGKNKIRPDEDKAPGLILTFRGIELTPHPDKNNYTLKLVGEFNSTEFLLEESQIKSLFAGKVTTWDLSNETSRSTGGTRYQIKTQLKLRLSLENQTLRIHSLQAEGSITTIGFTSKEKYVSPSISIGSPTGLGTLYEGTAGTLPKLSTIN